MLFRSLALERDHRTKVPRRLRLNVAVAPHIRLLLLEIGLRGDGFIGLVEQPARLFGELRARLFVGKRLIDFQMLAELGTISEEDLSLIRYVDSPEQAWGTITDFYKL